MKFTYEGDKRIFSSLRNNLTMNLDLSEAGGEGSVFALPYIRALTHYNKTLAGTTIKIVQSEKESKFATTSWMNRYHYFKNPQDRVYKIKYPEKVTVGFDLKFKNLNKIVDIKRGDSHGYYAQVGNAAHELGHIVQYHNLDGIKLKNYMNSEKAKLFFRGKFDQVFDDPDLMHFLHSYSDFELYSTSVLGTDFKIDLTNFLKMKQKRKEWEDEADCIAIEHGLAFPLYTWRKRTYNTIKHLKRDDYYQSPKSIVKKYNAYRRKKLQEKNLD